MTTVLSRDSQLKTMESTLSNAEKYMGQFCTLLAAYTRKTAKLRDKADTLVRQLYEFACTGDSEMNVCLKNFSEDLAMVQDYRQAQVERLETRVVAPLKAYGDIVKAKRADLKKFSTDRKREVKELQRLETLRLRNPADRQGISQAEVNVQKATSYAHRSTQQMEDIILDFQRHKLEDVKRIFRDFIMVEMLFHTKAVEVYTHTFKNMETMDIDKDLQVFRNRIQLSEALLENTASTAAMLPYPSPSSPPLRLARHPSPPPSIPRMTLEQPKESLRRTLLREREAEDEEEEEEDDEEEEERYNSEDDLGEPRTIRRSYAAEYVRNQRQK
ncbi:CBY1-interacting BAR domain-containing protein 2 [Electrophorus electricus]|uniref:CBY1-interacting BAR domain-containing protein 2 n=1 Tax=Electrophorus electricus TaxID=8005 RepID=UPI0015CFC5E1|nr:CBY1-interacting BAR domain-containing protein 2 [Electrophorus electricus]